MISNIVIKSKERVKNTLSLDYFIDKAILWTVIISLLTFILYPIIKVISTSFYNKGVLTLGNYVDLFNARNIKLIKNSVFVVSLSSLLGTIISLSIALFAFVGKMKKKKGIYKSMLFTMVSPPFVSSLALITLFGRRGFITSNLLGLSVNPYGWQGIVLLQALGKVPLGVIMLITAINAVDQRHIFASRDLGATSFKTLKNILLPGILPTILSVLFLSFTMNLADFGTPIIIGGKFKMLATEIYMTIFSSSNLGKAAAMNVLLIPPAVLAFLFYKKSMDSISNKSEGLKTLGNQSYGFDVPLPLKLFLVIVTVSFFVISILKYGTIFLTAISINPSGKIMFTLEHIKKVKVAYVPVIIRSINFAIIAGVVSSTVGILLSYYTHRRKIAGMKYIEFVSALPYIIPGIFFGLGYIIAFKSRPLLLTGTTAIVVLNTTFRHISVANKAANAAFTTIDTRLEDSSRDLGASHFKSIINIVFPILKPIFLTSFINTFSASMTTVGAIIFLVSPRNVVASVVMFKEIINGGYGQASVMAGILILITVGINLIAVRLLDKEEI